MSKTANISEKQALSCVQQKISVLQKAALQCNCFAPVALLGPHSIKDTALCDVKDIMLPLK